MNQKNQLLCAWAGLLTVLFFFLAAAPLSRLMPLNISPVTGPADLAAFYDQNQFNFMLGMISFLVGGATLLPFASVISNYLKKIEGVNPVMANTMMAASILVSVEIMLPPWVFATIEFRPITNPDVLQAFSDLALLMFTWPNPVAILMVASTGLAILSDKRPAPIFPRWIGFYNIAMILLYFPSCFLVLFKTGPVAWNGVLSFWVPAVDFGTWFFVMFYGVMRAIKNEKRDEGQ